MSQFDWGVMDPNSKSGPQLALDLNDFRDALNTLHRGATRPPYAQPGMLWVKEVSSERWDLSMYDGSTDLVLRSFNPTTSELFKLLISDVDGLSDAIDKGVQKDAPTTTGAALLPAGSSAQRPAAPLAGMLRFNADLVEFERYQGGKWLALNVLDKALNEAPIVTLASAATANIGAATANTLSISGTNTINAFDTIAAGAIRRLVFQGALTLIHNASSLILPGAANITTAAGDAAVLISLGGGAWRCINYSKSSGRAVVEGGVGTGQSWQDVRASRSVNTTYTNSTSLPITVSISLSHGSGSYQQASLVVDGLSVAATNQGSSAYSQAAQVTALVPPGSTYRLAYSAGSISIWTELR